MPNFTSGGGGGAGSVLSSGGPLTPQGIFQIIRLLGGRRNTQNLVPGVSFPGYNPDGTPIDDEEGNMPLTGIQRTPEGGGWDWNEILKHLPPIPNINIGGRQNNAAGSNSSGIPPWLLAILAGVSGGLENREGTTETTSTEGPTTTTSGQTLSPEATTLQGSILEKIMKQLNEDPDLTGYGANQLSEINRNYGQLKDTRRSELMSRGITGPALEAAISGLDNERFGQGVQVRNQLPLLANQLRDRAINTASGFYSSMPRTSTITNSGRTNTSTIRQSGNIFGGGLSSLTAMLARLYGMGAA